MSSEDGDTDRPANDVTLGSRPNYGTADHHQATNRRAWGPEHAPER